MDEEVLQGKLLGVLVVHIPPLVQKGEVEKVPLIHVVEDFNDSLIDGLIQESEGWLRGEGGWYRELEADHLAVFVKLYPELPLQRNQRALTILAIL